jgi:3-oxoacyl-[acyl-carrier-protein] synthase III
MISQVSPIQRKGGFAIPDVAIRGIVSAVPSRRIENDYFVGRFGEKASHEVAAMTGVATRHWVEPWQTTSDLCLAATTRLLERLKWDPHSIDALIFVSQTPDFLLPATACVLHGQLGLSQNCQAFDVNLGCSGYVYGLWLTATLINAGCHRVLVLAGDTSSRMLDPLDRSTAMLFGDAGTASAVESHRGASPTTFVLGTDGTGASNLMVSAGGFRAPPADERRRENADPTTLFMDGSEVFSFTLNTVPKMITQTLAVANLTLEDIDAFALHQANRFLLRHIAKKLKIPPDRMPINIERYGNTSSASIPLLLTSDLAPRITAEATQMMMVGFGVGYSWAAACLRLMRVDCAETILI